MKRCVVDTNVLIVANGRVGSGHGPTPSCKLAAVDFLIDLRNGGLVLVDAEGAIQAEYKKHMNSSGQPGVGDRLYHEVIQCNMQRVERVPLPIGVDGEYADLPRALIKARFDPSDRKFAALAKKCNVPVINATDSDWVNAAAVLNACGIEVEHLCGCDMTKWFTT